MFILWRRTRNGYTVVDTSDFSEEEYDRPTLRKIVRSSGVKVQGITIDDKNVIHFKAQSKAYNNTAIDAARARGALSGAYQQNRKEYVVPPCPRVERYDIPFLGADVTYVITDATLQNADIVSLPMGARKIKLSIENPVQLKGFILPPTVEELKEDAVTRVSYYYDFPWYFNHCYLNCIPPVSDLRYLHDFENCKNARLPGSSSKGVMRLKGSYRITDTVCWLENLAIVPDILIISNAVQVVGSYWLGMNFNFEGIDYGKDRTKYKQASLNAAEWVFNHQSTYIEERGTIEKFGTRSKIPRIIQFEDVRQIEELKLGMDTAGTVFIVPRGSKRYFATELLAPTVASRNIVIEF